MKILKIVVIVFILLINLVVVSPSGADDTSNFKSNNYFIGQKVIWLYKARADSENIQRIPVEVVKLGSKQVQVKVQKNKNQFVNRWVNRDRLEPIK